MQRVDSLEKTLMLGEIRGRRRRGRQRMRWLDGIADSMEWLWVNSGIWWWTGRPGVLRFMGSQRVRHDWATELNLLVEDAECLLMGLVEGMESRAGDRLWREIRNSQWGRNRLGEKIGTPNGNFLFCSLFPWKSQWNLNESTMNQQCFRSKVLGVYGPIYFIAA